MFRRSHTPSAGVVIYVDGKPVHAAAEESVAAAMLVAGFTSFRASAVSAAPRAPHCMIGNCFECLVEINGQPDRQACLTIVSDGMHVRRQAEEPGP